MLVRILVLHICESYLLALKFLHHKCVVYEHDASVTNAVLGFINRLLASSSILWLYDVGGCILNSDGTLF